MYSHSARCSSWRATIALCFVLLCVETVDMEPSGDLAQAMWAARHPGWNLFGTLGKVGIAAAACGLLALFCTRQLRKMAAQAEHIVLEQQAPDSRWMTFRSNPFGWILSRITLVMFVPYGLFNARFRGKPWWTRIDDSLILGAMPLRRHIDELVQKEGVKAIVNTTEEWREHKLLVGQGIEHLRIKCIDLTCPSLPDLVKAVEFITRYTDRSDTVYVHCKAGQGRSATIVMCYLMQRYHYTPDEAFSHIVARRSWITGNLASRRTVQEYYRRFVLPLVSEERGRSAAEAALLPTDQTTVDDLQRTTSLQPAVERDAAEGSEVEPAVAPPTESGNVLGPQPAPGVPAVATVAADQLLEGSVLADSKQRRETGLWARPPELGA